MGRKLQELGGKEGKWRLYLKCGMWMRRNPLGESRLIARACVNLSELCHVVGSDAGGPPFAQESGGSCMVAHGTCFKGAHSRFFLAVGLHLYSLCPLESCLLPNAVCACVVQDQTAEPGENQPRSFLVSRGKRSLLKQGPDVDINSVLLIWDNYVGFNGVGAEVFSWCLTSTPY